MVKLPEMPMRPLFALYFDTPGEVEYVLGKAGLYQAIRTESGSRAEPTEELRRFFPGGNIPPEETLVPLLAQIVDFSDRLGAVNRTGERSRIIDALQQLGITHEHGAISQLLTVIRQATQEAAMDVAKLPPARPL